MGSWLNKLFGGNRTEKQEAELLTEMSPADRRFAEESIEDHRADEFVGYRRTGVSPESFVQDDHPPKY
jgi:hypothetical protein